MTTLKSIIEKSDSKVRDFWLQVAGYPSFEELSKIIQTRDQEILGAIKEWAKNRMKTGEEYLDEREYQNCLSDLLTFINSAKEK